MTGGRADHRARDAFARLVTARSLPLGLLIAVFCLAFVTGGSATVPSAVGIWLTTIVAAGATAAFLLIPASDEAPVRRLIWLACAAPILAGAQLIPLPPAIWTMLPGRELERAIVELVGSGDRWMPLSLRPLDGMRALLHLAAPLAVFLGLTRIGIDQINIFLTVMLGAIGLSVLIGAAQFGSGGALLSFYHTRHGGFPIGLFSNRNHQADAVILGYLLGCYFIPRLKYPPHRLIAWLGATGGLLLFMAAAASRSGMQLALIAAAATLPLFFDGGLLLRRKKVVATVVIAVGGIAAIILLSAPGQQIAARFHDFASDHRLEYWRMALPLLRDYWTVGAGFGSFPRLYMTVEPISVLRVPYVNAAHNDYLQLAIEGGLPALLLLLVFLAFLGRGASRLSRVAARSSDSARLAWLMLCGILVLMLHSAVDYPLRTTSLACVWAAMVAIFFRMAAWERQSLCEYKDKAD